MKKSSCTVCNQSLREDIEEAVRKGEPYRALGERFGLSRCAISRHVVNHAPYLRLSSEEAKIVREMTEEKLENLRQEPGVEKIQEKLAQQPAHRSFIDPHKQYKSLGVRMKVVEDKIGDILLEQEEIEMPEVTGPVGLFQTSRECIGPNQAHYDRFDCEIWPLDAELGPYWRRIETHEELQRADAGKGTRRQSGEYRTESDGSQVLTRVRKLGQADVARMRSAEIEDRLEERRQAMDFRPIYYGGQLYWP